MAMTEQEKQALALKLFVVLTKAQHAAMQVAQNDIRSHGLNVTEFAVLELLFHKGAMPLQQIGQRILLTSGSMTYVIDRLVEKGFVERQRCAKDQRIFYATLTELGQTLMIETFPKHEQTICQLMSVLSESEQEIVIQSLKKIGYHAQDMI